MKSLKGPVGKDIAASSGEKTGQSFQGSYPGRFFFLADAAISIKKKKKKPPLIFLLTLAGGGFHTAELMEADLSGKR